MSLDSQSLADALAHYAAEHPLTDQRVGAALQDEDLDIWDAPVLTSAVKTAAYSLQTVTRESTLTQRPSTPLDHPWPPQLLVDLALDIEEPDAIAAKHGMDTVHLQTLRETAAFQSLVLTTKSKLQNDGELFKARAVAQAEMLLEQAYRMAVDPNVPHAIRMQLIAMNVKWAELDPEVKAKQKASMDGNVMPVQININL